MSSLTEGRGDLRRLLAYALPYRRRLAMVLALSFLSTILSLAIPYLSKELVDRALVGRDMRALLRILAAFGILSVASFAVNAISGLRYTRVSADILFGMRLALYTHLQSLSPRFWARARLGDVLSRVNNDIGEIQRIAAETALAWVGNVLFLAGSIAAMLWLDWRLFLVGVAAVPLGVWAIMRYRRLLEHRIAGMRQSSAAIGSFLIETLQGARLVSTSNAGHRERERFRERNDAFVSDLMSMQRASYLSGGLPGLILSGGTLLLFLYGGHEIIAGRLRLGTFVAFVAYQARLFPPVQALMGLYAGIAGARVSLRRVGELFDTVPEVVEQPEAIPLDNARGEIAFEEVTLSHGRGAAVLERVSFVARAGETLAIVGPSGGGKSTIADLAVRLLDPDAGAVRLDGHDLRDLRLRDLRRHVAVVEQTPFLFHATIAENLRYARPEASDADLETAAQAAGIAEFIRSLPDAYATEVGERGLTLSAGERQRIAIARAFLADPAVLVLDEPTAALDPISERRMMTGGSASRRGRTTIVITHRLDLAMQADRVIVLDDARIVESGSPAELRSARTHFARLFAADAVSA